MAGFLTDRYSDISLNPSLNNEGDVSQVYDNDSISQSLFVILNTRRGHRLMSPDFGCNVQAYLFEPMDDETSSKIKKDINYAFSRFEPRIKIQNIDVKQDHDNLFYSINVFYLILKLQTFATFTVDLQKL